MREQALARVTTTRPSAQHAPSRDTTTIDTARADLGGFLLQLQRSHGNRYVQRLVDQGRSVPSTRIPDGIKAALERQSGVDLSGVRVYYHSPRPARLGALAYTQGEEIHVAPGQERHLAHEAWHVVQQRQGRVRATRNDAGVPLNDDAGLEREANHAGQASLAAPRAPARPSAGRSPSRAPQPGQPAPIQLTRDHVDAQLREYRKGTVTIAPADWQKLLVIFSEWEEWQKKADACNNRYPAGTWRYNATVMITKKVMQTLNDNDEISLAVRRALIKRWNRDTANADQVIFKAPQEPEGMSLESGVVIPWGSLSPKAETYEYDPLLEISEDVSGPASPSRKKKRKPARKEKKRKDPPEPEAGTPPKQQRRKSKTLRTGKGREQIEEPVPIVETAQEAALMIRSFTKQEELIPGGFKIIWGPGMFEKGPFQDIVYTLLGETETGSFAREGNVASWNDILKQVPKGHWKDPARFFRALQAVLSGRPPKDPVLALVVGAMICDVKHGITEWVQLLSELYPMLPKLEPMPEPASIRELFTNWYEYSGRGGRDQRERAHRFSYRDEPRRVTTTEWTQPTLIPSRGSYHFPGATMPGFYKSHVWQIVLEAGDPAWFWEFALADKFLYNLLAERYRKSRGLEPT